MQSRGNAGIPLTTNIPYGYRKSPEDKNKWEIDEPAAEVVRRIFQMSVSGLGPTQIAKRLKADNVMTPAEYRRNVGKKPGICTERPCNWCSHTVAEILDRQEYVGDTVNFRSVSQSFKQKKAVEQATRGMEDLPQYTPRYHRPGETFALVQNLRQHRRRPDRTGIVSLRASLLCRLWQEAVLHQHQQPQA